MPSRERAEPAAFAPKVTVVVPVYNPGPYLERCVASILGQSLLPGELEAIFVDDGSTDGSGERLDELASAHPHIRVIHQENSGWPGQPRNVGIDAARGEYVFFVDNDDALGAEALERLHAMAVRNSSDIVIGKMVGHRRGVPRVLFLETVERTTLADSPIVMDSLTPHKLFRLAFLAEHGIRFPEGRRRLEDHVFVVRAYFAARVISVLADYSCYYHVARPDRSNAAATRFEPPYYYGFVREVLGIVEAHTVPGQLRNQLLRRFAGVELLGRLRGRAFAEHPADYRTALFAEIRAVIDEHVPEGVDALLSPLQRTRMSLVRSDRLDLLVRLAAHEGEISAFGRAVAAVPERHGGLRLVVETGLTIGGQPFVLERSGSLVLLPLPAEIAAAVPEQARAVSPSAAIVTSIVMRRRDDSAEIALPAVVAHLGGGGSEARVEVALDGDLLRHDEPARPGRSDVYVRVEVAGVTRETRLVRAAGLDPGRRFPVADDRSVRVAAYWSDQGGYLALDVSSAADRRWVRAARRRAGRLVRRLTGRSIRR